MRLKGFTLVELAIVLVIIGIILGGVLKGQELIFNAKVKRLQSQIKEMMAAFYTYYDKYGYYPGDDPTASTRWDNATNGDGNGLISGDYCDAPTDESCLLWRHLRYANIISGDPTDSNTTSMTPKHAFGGSIHMFTNNTTSNRTGIWIALTNLEAQAAEAIDRAMDDGKCDLGSIVRLGGDSCGANSTYPRFGFMTIGINF